MCVFSILSDTHSTFFWLCIHLYSLRKKNYDWFNFFFLSTSKKHTHICINILFLKRLYKRKINCFSETSLMKWNYQDMDYFRVDFFTYNIFCVPTIFVFPSYNQDKKWRNTSSPIARYFSLPSFPYLALSLSRMLLSSLFAYTINSEEKKIHPAILCTM